MRTFSPALTLAAVFLSVAAILAVPHAFSQAPAHGPGFDGGQVILLRPQLGMDGSGCPVLLQASQRSLGRQVETGRRDPRKPAQGLTVTMTGFKALRITSAEVVAHALSPKNRAVLTTDEDDADVTRTFHLDAKDRGGFRGDLWMEGVTAIRWIEVKSLTYSNGSVWHESEAQRCVVSPDPFVLISSSR